VPTEAPDSVSSCSPDSFCETHGITAVQANSKVLDQHYPLQRMITNKL
jgi:hypothetical protein